MSETDTKDNWKLKLEPFQNILIDGEDCTEYFRVVKGQHVQIDVDLASAHLESTSCMSLMDMVNYNWPHMKSSENLIAFHESGQYIAYGITLNRNYSIRIHDIKADTRSRVHELPFPIVDIVFAKVPNELLLAAIDQRGNVHVYSIDKYNISQFVKYLDVHAAEYKENSVHKLAWFPREKENQNPLTLAVTRNEFVELWDVDKIRALYDTKNILETSQLKSCIVTFSNHEDIITSVKFSSDGNLLVTSSLDGKILFIMIYDEDIKGPRILKTWEPHNGAPVTSMLFLDNKEEEQFWNFIITFTKDNSIMKIWSCETWWCLQTFSFHTTSTKNSIHMIPYVDARAKFIYLSDYINKVFYVLDVYRSMDKPVAYVYKFNAFLVISPILSVFIASCQDVPRKVTTNQLFMSAGDEDDEVDFVDLQKTGYEYTKNNKVKLYILQPKSLQLCDLIFPSLNVSPDITRIVFGPPNSNFFVDYELDYKNVLNDSITEEQELKEAEKIAHIKKLLGPIIMASSASANHNLPLNQNSQQMDLMTPDAFTSTSQHNSPHSIHLNEESPLSSDVKVTMMIDVNTIESNLTAHNDPPPNDSSEIIEGISSGSSPSREVEEIMQHTEPKNAYEKNAVNGIDSEMQGIDLSKATLASALLREKAVNAQNIHLKKEQQVRLNDHVIITEQLQLNQNHNISKTPLQDRKLEDIVATLQAMSTSLQSLTQHVNTTLNIVNQSNAAIENQGKQIVALEHKLERIVVDNGNGNKNERMNQEHLVSQITQAVHNVISEKVQGLIITQFNTSLLPTLLESMNPLKNQLQSELTKKLTATDSLLKENLSKIVQSKSVLDTISNSVIMALQATMKECFKEYFRKTIPEYQKATQVMFQQLSENYDVGVRNVLASYEQNTGNINKQTKDCATKLHKLSEGLTTVHNSMTMNINKSFLSLESNLNETLIKHLTSQKADLEGAVINAVQSRTVTPVPTAANQAQMVQAQLKSYIAQKQYSSAFQQALSAQNLNLVIFVCENIDPNQLFDIVPCPLGQNVLISLIQQLAGDLGLHSILKCRYLDEALSALDMSHSITREHGPTILNESLQKLKLFTTNNPTHKAIKNLKKLERVMSGVLNELLKSNDK